MDGGKLHDARTELLWGHAVADYWDTQLGVCATTAVSNPSANGSPSASRAWRPHWFEIDATAYVGEQGRTALRFDVEYELLLTQKLILQPRTEANFLRQK